jgi:hypothetical protein
MDAIQRRVEHEALEMSPMLWMRKYLEALGLGTVHLRPTEVWMNIACSLSGLSYFEGEYLRVACSRGGFDHPIPPLEMLGSLVEPIDTWDEFGFIRRWDVQDARFAEVLERILDPQYMRDVTVISVYLMRE